MVQKVLEKDAIVRPYHPTAVRIAILDETRRRLEIVTLGRAIYDADKPYRLDTLSQFGCYSEAPITYNFRDLNGRNSNIGITYTESPLKVEGRIIYRLRRGVVATLQMKGNGGEISTYTPFSDELTTDEMVDAGRRYIE
jgi:hypothetical protein